MTELTKLEQLSECKCSLSIRVLGDGCRYCQPQTYIDFLERTVTELEQELQDKEDKEVIDAR